jgi:hypothetical protein
VSGEALAEALERIHCRLTGVAGAAEPREAGTPAASAAAGAGTLSQLQRAFGLSAFERDLLVLCAGVSIEARFPSACAAAHGNAQSTWPTFGLALALLENPHWSAISRARPLRYWSLLEVVRGPGSTAPLIHAPLQIDERVLQYLLGVPDFDERLEALIRPLATTGDHRLRSQNARLNAVLDEGLRHWRSREGDLEPLLLTGDSRATREAAFREVCRRAGLNPYQLNAAELPAAAEERRTLARLWTREAAFQNAALLIRYPDGEGVPGVGAWLELVQAPVAVDAHEGSPAERLPALRLDIPALSTEERRAAWISHLGESRGHLNGALDRIVEYFHFDESSIRSAACAARVTPVSGADEMENVAWRICRQHGRRSLDNLARRIEPRATWSQLVLPAQQTETLRQIAVHVRQRATVNYRWGFSERYSRGHGLSALFTGGSGTGKTMAAEILAGELNLDLYQIDLASMVSKYIGETEKNLRRVFDAAEESGAVLLFDECDALFGKRSEVRDSHDRYANLEVSYLLQRVESYRGVAILTTNMQHALDSAFMRRIRFIVQFPFPDPPSRARIWQTIFPEAAPLEGLDFGLLSQLNVSGGVIRNIATHAAFLAADEGAAIAPRHILAAARIEYSKMEKPLTASETRGLS